jgi:putative acetyltransferase
VPDLDIRVDDLTGEQTRALVAFHLSGMHDSTPPENVFALDVDGLRAPGVTFWSAWDGDTLVGIAALKELDDANGEVKSMRVTDAARGTGAGRALLRHLVAEARARGYATLWLETGTPDDFIPARRLYASEGFVECGPFGDYPDSPYSVFMRLALVV